MKKFHVFAVLAIIGAAVFGPNTTEAFFTTDQQAVRLNDQKVLFTITYRFGFINHGFSMPILTDRAGEKATSTERLQFALEANGVDVDWGDVFALAITEDEDAVMENGRYNFAPRKGADFVFTALVTLPNEIPDVNDLRLRVTHLPFTMTDLDGDTMYYQLTDEYLDNYRTPGITLGS